MIGFCFSYFTANNWFNFREVAVARSRSIYMLDKANPTGKTHPLPDAAKDRLPATTII